ncbi:MAG: hypothetical protein WCN92_08615 [Eubacteriales bacterium]
MEKSRIFLPLLAASIIIIVIFSGCAKKTVETVTTTGTTAASTAVLTTVKETTPPTTAAAVTAAANVYQNTQYGFSFTLPESWKGYKIITGKWEGVGLLDSASRQGVETGPIISIRHPLWTSADPRQDIPIMVFTIAQWESLQREEFSVGAAPMPPSEIARNAKYVFALPARYNYSFLTGFEEVETILKGNPLKPF